MRPRVFLGTRPPAQTGPGQRVYSYQEVLSKLILICLGQGKMIRWESHAFECSSP